MQQEIYITGLDVPSERNDQLTLIPLLEEMDKNLGQAYDDVTTDAGYESEIIYYGCEDCTGCPHKKGCTRAKGNRKMQLSKEFLRQRKQSLKNITSEKKGFCAA